MTRLFVDLSICGQKASARRAYTSAADDKVVSASLATA